MEVRKCGEQDERDECEGIEGLALASPDPRADAAEMSHEPPSVEDDVPEGKQEEDDAERQILGLLGCFSIAVRTVLSTWQAVAISSSRRPCSTSLCNRWARSWRCAKARLPRLVR